MSMLSIGAVRHLLRAEDAGRYPKHSCTQEASGSILTEWRAMLEEEVGDRRPRWRDF